MDATDPDLSDFAGKGHKLVLWHGWSDAALSALASIRYFEEAEHLDPGVRDYFRLFMMPGVLHCGGGPGPGEVNWLKRADRLGGRGQGARTHRSAETKRRKGGRSEPPLVSLSATRSLRRGGQY